MTRQLVVLLFAISLIFSATAETRENYLGKVEEAFLRDDYELAQKLAKNLLAENSGQASQDRLLLILAMSQLKLSEYQQAIDNFKTVIQRYPGSRYIDDAYVGIGDCLYLKEDFEGAYKRYKEVIDKRLPDGDALAQAYLRLGKASQKLGRWQESKDYFNTVITRYPLSFEAVAAGDYLRGDEKYFTLQLGAFANKENAAKLLDELQGKGYDASIYNIDVAGKTFFRVRVGRFSSREEALTIQKRLSQDGYPSRIFP